MNEESVCKRIHSLLSHLPVFSSPSSSLPSNGLYFFYEKSEANSHDGTPRIVRIGNHPRSQNGLVHRLRQHYSGNKNSSVFRKALGGALMRLSDPNHPCLQPAPGSGHWEEQNSKTCDLRKPIEQEVTSLLRKQFRFRVVMINNQSFRNLMEKKLIVALSTCPACQPSEHWLGHEAYSEKVKSSGMWNSDYVGENHAITEKEWEGFTRAVHETREYFQDEEVIALLGFAMLGGFDDKFLVGWNQIEYLGAENSRLFSRDSRSPPTEWRRLLRKCAKNLNAIVAERPSLVASCARVAKDVRERLVTMLKNKVLAFRITSVDFENPLLVGWKQPDSWQPRSLLWSIIDDIACSNVDELTLSFYEDSDTIRPFLNHIPEELLVLYPYIKRALMESQHAWYYWPTNLMFHASILLSLRLPHQQIVQLNPSLD